MKVTKTDLFSPAWRCGIRPGDSIREINGHRICDVLDYKFYSYEKKLLVTLEGEDGKERKVTLRKREGEDIGLEFETYLMDRPRSCANRCIFCFIDQLPKGLRDSLYVKDDDMRLSFLLGNYITLTNLSEQDIERICTMRISPINISVHATDPAVREMMLRNKNAGKCMDIMRRFAEARISMQCQIVVCPGINDGEILLNTLRDLESLYPTVGSVSVVPVGITRFREGLYPLNTVTRETAGEIIDMVEEFSRGCMEKYMTSFVYCSDEMYLRSGRELPEYDFYEEFSQLENGVGLMRLFEHELKTELDKVQNPRVHKKFSIVSGVSAAPFMQKMLDYALQKCDNVDSGAFHVYPIENNFFGTTVDVAGLVVGGDIIAQLKEKSLGDILYIPAVMLRHGGDMFLDDMTVADLEQELSVKVSPLEVDGASFIKTIFG
ncbi:MAG: DUF512 domain-containing protein [Clostridiales bacterium]|nr:DUF512 domain-containing protein [Clostridiales bacterium]